MSLQLYKSAATRNSKLVYYSITAIVFNPGKSEAFDEFGVWAPVFLTLSVSVSYQQPTSPYITPTKYDIW